MDLGVCSGRSGRAHHRLTRTARFLASLLACLGLLALIPTASAQYTNQIDISKTWSGYMIWTSDPGNPPGIGGSGTSVWAPANLRANFSGTNLILRPNVNTYNATDPYWVNTNTLVGANIMDANFYVTDNSLAVENSVTFQGTCLSNTLASGYVSVAFIKELDSSYNLINIETNILVDGSPFSVTLYPSLDPNSIIQYGFETIGLNADPATADSLGSVVLAVPPSLGAVPTVNAPTPARPDSTVLSMYASSGIYSNHPGIGWYAGWSGAVGSDFTIPTTGRVVKKYAGLSFAGVEFYSPNQINASGMTTLHVDLWTPNANKFGVKLVSLGPTADPQVNITAGSGKITTNGWVSLDIPLSAFKAINPALDLANLQQLLWIDNNSIPGGGVENGTFYIDNVYFWTTNGVKSSIALGSQVSWTADSERSYQPQESPNGSTWSNLGGQVNGNTPDSVFDSSPAPFYRVQETYTGGTNGVVNSGIEIADGGTGTGAQAWLSAGGGGAIATVTRTNLDPHTGSMELDIEAQGNGVSGPGPVALQNDVPIEAGAVAFSFYAKAALSSGGANPQYQVLWFDAASNPLGGSGFTSFSSTLGSSYTKQTAALTAPTNTAKAQIQFLLAGGAGVGDHWLVRIDDVSLRNTGIEIVTTPGTNTASNVGFETAGANTTGAQDWDAAGGGGAIATALRVGTDPYADSYHLELEGQGNGASGVAAIALQNNIPVQAGPVILSFYAKGAQMDGGANPQCGVFWFDSGNNPLGGGFTSFPSALTGSYAQQTKNLTAPANSHHAQLQFLLGVGAGTNDHWIVRIDEVSFAGTGSTVTNILSSTTNILAAAVQSGVGVSWPSGAERTYTVQSRDSLEAGGWSSLGGNVVGNGATKTVSDVATNSTKFYRVLEVQ